MTFLPETPAQSLSVSHSVQPSLQVCHTPHREGGSALEINQFLVEVRAEVLKISPEENISLSLETTSFIFSVSLNIPETQVSERINALQQQKETNLFLNNRINAHHLGQLGEG